MTAEVITLRAGKPMPIAVKDDPDAPAPDPEVVEVVEEQEAEIHALPVTRVAESVKVPDLSGISSDEADALRQDMLRMVADIEFRLAQQYEMMRRAEGLPVERVYAEDIHSTKHQLTGYNLLSNSNGSTTLNGSIAWQNLHVVYLGVDYTCANGTTANKYVWFVKPASGTAATLNTGNTIPSLGPDDQMLFVNDGGTARQVEGISYAVGDNAVGDDQISGGISQDKIGGLATTLDGLNNKADLAQATADGAITQTFGPTFPWNNGDASAGGADSPAAKIGDVHTFQGATNQTTYPDGVSYKWSGSAGNPQNQWVLISDANLSKALSDAAAAKDIAAGKTTVYYRTVAQGAPPVPTDGFATGDEWRQTDNDNYTQRWTGSTWTPATIGNAQVSSGISGGKIGPGIAPSNLTGTGTIPVAGVPTLDLGTKTTGTLTGTRVGSGVSATNVTTGTLPLAVTPTIPTSKINTAVHLLY